MKDGTRFKPYPRYKDSGVEWLRRIPETWDVQKLKFACRLSRGGEIPEFGTNTLTAGRILRIQGQSDGIVNYLNERLLTKS